MSPVLDEAYLNRRCLSVFQYVVQFVMRYLPYSDVIATGSVSEVKAMRVINCAGTRSRDPIAIAFTRVLFCPGPVRYCSSAPRLYTLSLDGYWLAYRFVLRDTAPFSNRVRPRCRHTAVTTAFHTCVRNASWPMPRLTYRLFWLRYFVDFPSLKANSGVIYLETLIVDRKYYLAFKPVRTIHYHLPIQFEEHKL
jgi:hypothetical protein